MPKERLYLDTSVINVYRDPRDVFLQEQTRLFWTTLDRYQVFVSTVVLGEIGAAPVAIQEDLRTLVEGFGVLDMTPDADQLVERYVQEGVFVRRDINDAKHVAIATTADMDYLVSWNFRHLVRVKTRRTARGTRQWKLWLPRNYRRHGDGYLL